jgi:predicted ATPase
MKIIKDNNKKTSVDNFLLSHAEFEFENNESHVISFLGDEADHNNTHITIIAGANGTSKSRIVASIVEQFCELNAQRNKPEITRRYLSGGAHGITCADLSVIQNRQLLKYTVLSSLQQIDLTINPVFPSRILVLSNLVMDKFHFQKDSVDHDQFYHYLGVRQASNLMTTGSAERSVSEAVMSMVDDQTRLNLFRKWLELVFPGGRELAFEFPRLSRRHIETFLQSDDKTEFTKSRLEKNGVRVNRYVSNEIAEQTAKNITELFEFLIRTVSEYRDEYSSSKTRQKDRLFLRIENLSSNEAARFATLIPFISLAQKAGFSSWPSLCFEAKSWLPFNQLSSGEQNLLSVGAKLIAYARPGCLVAIDEPEVSLNVAWQQRYTELVCSSLSHATGSHVLIATHSPHLIASLPKGKASLVTIEKNHGDLIFKTQDAMFEGWGSESVLYQVLGITAACSHLFYKDLAEVLHHIQEGGKDKNLLKSFLKKTNQLNYAGVEPLEIVIKEVVTYEKSLP